MAISASKLIHGSHHPYLTALKPISIAHIKLVSEFAVFDRWFASVPSSTQPNRLYVHSATSHGATSNIPSLLVMENRHRRLAAAEAFTSSPSSDHHNQQTHEDAPPPRVMGSWVSSHGCREKEGVVGAEDLGSDGLEGVAGIWVDEVGLVVEEDSSGVGIQLLYPQRWQASKYLLNPLTSFCSIPSEYAYSTTHYTPIASDQEDSIPVIDYSLLISSIPDQRSKVIDQLGKACEEWGFFLLVNRGVPETLIDKVFDASNEFFNLSEDEKRNFDGKNALDPIRCRSSYHNARMENILFWRDYLKVIAHPEFHFPDKPAGFSELSFEYCERTRTVMRELLKGITKSLGLEESDMDNTLNLDSGLQLFAVNLYPPCPQPELAIGIPPHTDHGLVTLLIQNGVKGLEVQHSGKWINVDAPPNSFMVNTGDHLEVNFYFIQWSNSFSSLVTI
ncbi:hypothetical protein RJ640_012501 [Escallonia rubra]|uniref:Fe2OG dioxygenase domain-containing protein n=1 Tax=Escallonia rubra TaxID=112253 RepID=A0AA88QFD6_9ASTE|nr:hypothetical protein RJ640_012501 [Escallonia rubra]